MDPREGESLVGKEFYRYMSQAEVRAVLSTGLLRGGWPEETFFTKDYYESSDEAQAKLALRDRPEKRMRFRILSEPAMLRRDAEVAAHEGQPGGGTEYVTVADEKVEVEVVDVADLD